MKNLSTIQVVSGILNHVSTDLVAAEVIEAAVHDDLISEAEAKKLSEENGLAYPYFGEDDSKLYELTPKGLETLKEFGTLD